MKITIKIFFSVLTLLIISSSVCGKSYKQHKLAIKLNNEAMAVYITNPEKSLELLDKAISIDSSYKTAYSNKASVLASLNRNKDAIDTLNLLINQYPDYAEAYVGKAIIYEKDSNIIKARKNYKNALTIYNAKLSSNRNNSYFKSQRIYLLYKLGKKENAIKELDEFVKNNPNDKYAKSIEQLIKYRESKE